MAYFHVNLFQNTCPNFEEFDRKNKIRAGVLTEARPVFWLPPMRVRKLHLELDPHTKTKIHQIKTLMGLRRSHRIFDDKKGVHFEPDRH